MGMRYMKVPCIECPFTRGSRMESTRKLQFKNPSMQAPCRMTMREDKRIDWKLVDVLIDQLDDSVLLCAGQLELM